MKNVMLSAISKTQFQKLVIEATNDFRRLYVGGVSIPGTDASDKLAGIKRAIADSSIGKELKEAFINVMAVAIGGSVSVPRSPTADELKKQWLTFVPYAAVVPLRNRNHHKYEIGQPVIMALGCPGASTGMYGMDSRGVVGTPGNELPRLRKSLRPATPSEIYTLVDELYA